MSNAFIILKKNQEILSGTVIIDSSKSISNRALIIQALCDDKFEINNLSKADDTRILNDLIHTNETELNCGAGGTTFRFLLVLFVLTQKEVLLFGSDRLNERPVISLVNALLQLNAKITYSKTEGFPPLQISPSKLHGGLVDIDASISSQFISALMLIAPKLSGGINIRLNGEIVSSSYIKMTAEVMKYFGVKCLIDQKYITIEEQNYKSSKIKIPSDWSNAAYWFGFVACNSNAHIRIKNIAFARWQDDKILVDWMVDFGVKTTIDGKDLILSNTSNEVLHEVKINLINHPDLAQPLAFIAAIKGIKLELTGLTTLNLKETNRIVAIKNELEKTGVSVMISNSTISIDGKVNIEKVKSSIFETYNDHRMAMSISLLTSVGVEVKINNPEVISKSYPDYFNQLKNIGINIINNFSEN